MRKLSIIIFIIVITSIISIKINIENLNYNKTISFNSTKNNIECLYYNTVDFVNIKEFETKSDIGTIRGCIVPHHLVAVDLIHETFQNIQKHNYKTVVLIGPDHESIEKGKIFTTLKNWQTPKGILKTDLETTNKLLNNNFIKENDEKLKIEHSTSTIIPFIKHYLPNVEVITLVLTKQTKLEDINKLLNDLYDYVNINETLFVASVDFSHYLNLENAITMDLITMEAIKNKDINKIMSFTNDNLDSPISIAAMIEMMDKAAWNIFLLNHSNSELILKMKVEETTSYLTYLFY